MIRRWLTSTFGWPVVLGALSLTGLIGALLWDGVWDALGPILLAAAIAAVVWARFGRR